MTKCRENRRRRRVRRKRHERKLLDIAITNILEALGECWFCDCGRRIEGRLHCPFCYAEPPCGCLCELCEGERHAKHQAEDEFRENLVQWR